MDKSLDEQMQRQNLIHLLEALRGLPVDQVKVIYTGSHGHVTHCRVSAVPIAAEPRLATVTVEQVRPTAMPASPASPEAVLSSEILPLIQALQNFALHWAGLLDEGWPKDDGGDGTMRVQVNEGLLTLDHDVICIQNLHATLRATK